MNAQTMKCDVLVIGGGIAACFAAVKAREAGASVIMVDKGYVGRSGQSPYADGFLIFNPEWGHNLEASMAEINRHSEYLNDQYWTRRCLLDSWDRYQDLLDWGCTFKENPDGSLAVRQEGKLPAGAQFDKSAGAYGQVLRKKALSVGVEIVDQVMIVDFLKENGRIVGAIGLPNDNCDLITFISKTTISCVGACGYKPTGYPPLMQLTCDGEAMAYRAGAEILGKEFVDAHYSKDGMPDPVGQRTAGDPPPVVGPGPGDPGSGPKDDGGPKRRVNAAGEVISDRPDSVSGYMFTYLQSEFAVHAGQGPIYSRGAKSFGGAALGMSLRKADGLFPADRECRSSLPGLFAAGDALGNMQNGAAYSTGGGSIEGGSVTGTIAGQAAAKEAAAMEMPLVSQAELQRARDYVLDPLKRKSGFGPRWAMELLRNYMMPYFVYFIKKADRLRATLTLITFLEEHISPMLFATDAHELRLAHEAKNMILSAEMRLRSGLFRTESRGNHYREDYPNRDDENWFCWTKIKNVDGEMVLEKAPLPEEYRPDPSLSYREKYPFPFPGEKEA